MSVVRQEIRTQPRPRCLLCGAEGRKLYASLADPFFDAPGVWDFKQCPTEACGVIWLDPAPVAGDLHLAYKAYFTHSEEAGGLARSKNARELLYQIYRFTMSLPAALTGLASSKRRLRVMCLGDLTPGKLLDVGCGDGAFLSRMRDKGWAVDGIDFDPKAIQSAKLKYGLELRQGDLRSAGFGDRSFDAVTLSHVIEHVPDPLALLQEVHRILTVGGRMALTTPNPSSLGHEQYGSSWFGLDAPRHLHLFPLRTLSDLAGRAGFKVLESSSSAANADIFIGASISIETAPEHKALHLPPPSLTRTLKAIQWQYREHFTLKSRPDCGEEGVLICAK
jgi:2-polyprenyl-3-methyl-5-hydroxy-6-metoxy-1,4-benzoquinol methylase